MRIIKKILYATRATCLRPFVKYLGTFQSRVKISEVGKGGEILTQNQQMLPQLLNKKCNVDAF